MNIEPRLDERRREVAEEHAARNTRRLLRFLAWVTGAGVGLWVLMSPWLSVASVTTAGIVSSSTEEILAANDVAPGKPMAFLRTGAAEAEIERDPWVVSARVDRHWPDQVVVRVVERVPAAWVETSGGWARRAIDGHPLPGPEEPDNSLGWVRLPTVTDEDAIGSDLVIGSVEFLEALPDVLASATAVRLESGELWAVVEGHQVRLGRPREMTAKALSLVTLLTEEEIPQGAVVTLVAPTHPAVSPSQTDG